MFAFRIRSVDKDTKNLSLCNRDSSNFYVNILKKINFQPPRNSHANLNLYFVFFTKAHFLRTSSKGTGTSLSVVHSLSHLFPIITYKSQLLYVDIGSEKFKKLVKIVE